MVNNIEIWNLLRLIVLFVLKSDGTISGLRGEQNHEDTGKMSAMYSKSGT